MKTNRTFQIAQSSAPTTVESLESNQSVRVGLLSLTLLLGTAASSFAQQQPQRPVHTKQTDAELWVTIDNPTLERVQVRVVQLATSSCLSNEVNRQSSYGCKLNFDKLPVGEYAVLMRVGRERYRYSVRVKAQHSTIVVRELGTPAGERTLASAAL